MEELYVIVSKRHFFFTNQQKYDIIIQQRKKGGKVAMKPARKLNYYELLGVTRESTSEEIKKAYHDCVKEFHPDLYEHKEEVSELEIKIRENILKQINAAYETLSDFYKSCRYDSILEAGEMSEKERYLYDYTIFQSPVSIHIKHFVDKQSG